MFRRLVLFFTFGLVVSVAGHAQSPSESGCDAVPASSNCTLLDDFESDRPDTPPRGWRTDVSREKLIPLTDDKAMNAQENVYVRREEGNSFARVSTKDEAFRVVLSHKHGLKWHVGKRPYLRWTWRAKALPEGANEKYNSSNDTGGALYVTFDTDWLGRPKSIKYTYSSALPVGTTVDYGPLKVLVVASKEEQGLDRWITHTRNVAEDYERLFGGSPDKTPLAIMMWSDSDTMSSIGTIDFDDLMLLSKVPRRASSTAESK